MRVLGTMISVIAFMIGSVGCGKTESRWESAMPSKFAALSVKEGGTCYLDAIGTEVAGPAPITIKSGAPMSVTGWIVPDLAAGRVASALGIQLSGSSSYFFPAEGYPRPGLGAALKSPGVDGGGLKVDVTPINVPAGSYKIIFLGQLDSTLVKCDTGHTLRVE